MHDFEEQWDEMEICPNCTVGHIKTESKPYLKLFHGQLFTMPDAVCYQCDICNYYEFDESTFDVISDMMFAATRQPNQDNKTRPIPSIIEDESSARGKPPHF